MAVYCIEGQPREGKSTYATWRAWQDRQKGRFIYSNQPLYDFRRTTKAKWVDTPEGRQKLPPGWPVDPRTFGKRWARRVWSMDQLLRLNNATVILDEADGWWHNSDWDVMTEAERQFFKQHGKGSIDLYLVCPHVEELAVSIRRLLHRVITVTKVMQWPLKTEMGTLPQWVYCRFVESNPRDDGNVKERRERRPVFYHLFDKSIMDLHDTASRVATRSLILSGNVEADRGAGLAYQHLPTHRLADLHALDQVGDHLARQQRLVGGPIPHPIVETTYERLPPPGPAPEAPSWSDYVKWCEEEEAPPADPQPEQPRRRRRRDQAEPQQHRPLVLPSSGGWQL